MRARLKPSGDLEFYTPHPPDAAAVIPLPTYQQLRDILPFPSQPQQQSTLLLQVPPSQSDQASSSDIPFTGQAHYSSSPSPCPVPFLGQAHYSQAALAPLSSSQNRICGASNLGPSHFPYPTAGQRSYLVDNGNAVATAALPSWGVMGGSNRYDGCGLTNSIFEKNARNAESLRHGSGNRSSANRSLANRGGLAEHLTPEVRGAPAPRSFNGVDGGVADEEAPAAPAPALGYENGLVIPESAMYVESQQMPHFVHVPIFRSKKRIYVKKQSEGCCGCMNVVGLCDRNSGLFGFLNLGGCLDRDMVMRVDRFGKPKGRH